MAAYPFLCLYDSHHKRTYSNPVDTQTRHAMKRDALVDSAQSAMGWFEDHKSEAILFAVVLVVVLAVGIGSILFYQHRQAQASAEFGAAMDIYNAPLAQSDEPSRPGVRTYPTAVARAEAAHEQFARVAEQYGSSEAGKRALYFSGLTEMEMGKTSEAEITLKKVVSKGNKNLAALGNLALVGLYRQTGRTAEAIQLLNKIAEHPTTTVPAGTANLELADIYTQTNPEQAKKIYAQLKDKDSKTAAGQIAAQKLEQMH